MDEDGLGWIGRLRPFGTADAALWEIRLGRCASLGQALWGKSTDDLRRQLTGPYPEIPRGFNLADFRVLLRKLQNRDHESGRPAKRLGEADAFLRGKHSCRHSAAIGMGSTG